MEYMCYNFKFCLRKHKSFIRLSPYFTLLKLFIKWFFIIWCMGILTYLATCILGVFVMCCHVFVRSTLKDVVKRVWVVSDERGCPTWTRRDIRSIVLLGLEIRRIWERRHILPLSSLTYAFPLINYEVHLFVIIFLQVIAHQLI